ncbi:hypothetical protein [Azospirillum thermophilum]|uniref:Gfo/Idh/MocA family oxidoreductase n=1 Tax=Azospirillum thermophilum TaxID=2202148 RepID=A0A2S2D0S9_9PROT|nr:hypothetical protein [Azospirillum thermophilum]AWK90250.1 hypothetical protein DEW08_30025 [Azospirillum thermophilum]
MSPPLLDGTALVIGQGSIGKRHARLLGELGLEVATVSRRPGGDFAGIPEALAAGSWDLAVVATETAAHRPALGTLAMKGFTGRVLVEKPLFDHPAPLPDHRFASLHVAYQLRFHPALVWLRHRLRDERVLSVQGYVGQYLPDWRPGRDYRRSYSARAALGGGVLRDLSHELDYLGWILGPWRRLAALGGQSGALEIDSEDVVVLLGELDRCPALSLQLNYLDRQTRRELVINTAFHTVSLDLVTGTGRVDRDPPQMFAVERDGPYRAMHRAILDGTADGPCEAGGGMAVLAAVAAAETAIRERRWVEVENG